ncbi:RnfH family protein [Noviherbaspirillum sedimenti]|uniref:UPF0125 protein D3878_04170 n=1 Tax=Noviherbaspirillum sedimenti TaxID=2320865 RepID=A0A3A3GIX2_9BURK|nr:RnfH family protein [Noviherbaspirillum sedimenti]RJG00880.1 RnfH family protein [Noviherbaspirillum sedimenti]
MSDTVEMLQVQVCYARPDAIFLEELTFTAGTTLEQAIRASGILARAPEIDLAVCKLGIFGKLKPLETILRDRDRIEIYRPLQADPKEARRRRVVKKEKTR